MHTVQAASDMIPTTCPETSYFALLWARPTLQAWSISPTSGRCKATTLWASRTYLQAQAQASSGTKTVRYQLCVTNLASSGLAGTQHTLQLHLLQKALRAIHAALWNVTTGMCMSLPHDLHSSVPKWLLSGCLST